MMKGARRDVGGARSRLQTAAAHLVRWCCGRAWLSGRVALRHGVIFCGIALLAVVGRGTSSNTATGDDVTFCLYMIVGAISFDSGA